MVAERTLSLQLILYPDFDNFTLKFNQFYPQPYHRAKFY